MREFDISDEDWEAFEGQTINSVKVGLSEKLKTMAEWLRKLEV